MKIAVIGGGPAGLTAAYKLSAKLNAGIETLDVYEASESVGGMARSIRLWDQVVDLGPHRFFSKDRRVNELWLEVAGKEYGIVQRQTRIYYKHSFFSYPIRIFNALKGLGIIEAIRCSWSYFIQKIFPTKDTSTFEGWVTRRFGKRLYQIFFKTYSEKLWGIPCTELDSDFASQRIKKMSFIEAIKNALYSSSAQVHATLVDQFAYPFNGSGSIYTRMKEIIEKRGGIIHLSTPVEKVLVENGAAKGLVLENGQELLYDHIITTMPISLLVNRMDGVPEPIKEKASMLRFRNTILVYLRIAQPELFKDQWLYIHDNSVETGRISNYRNWVPQLYGESDETILCMEYWCNFEDSLWKEDDEKLGKLAGDELTRIGLAKKEDIIDTHVFRIPRCYPVYFKNYRESLQPVEEFLATIGRLHVIGRYGAYKYNNQDHSILMGLLAAENILEGTSHQLWDINTDYEEYQESTSITETGLVSGSGN